MKNTLKTSGPNLELCMHARRAICSLRKIHKFENPRALAVGLTFAKQIWSQVLVVG